MREVLDLFSAEILIRVIPKPLSDKELSLNFSFRRLAESIDVIWGQFLDNEVESVRPVYLPDQMRAHC